MIELDPDRVAIGQSADTMERIALRLIGRVIPEGVTSQYHGPGKEATWTYGLPRVCERSTQPLPHGCWSYGDKSPYGWPRWCDACIAYAALNGTLPKPETTIDMTLVPKLAGVA